MITLLAISLSPMNRYAALCFGNFFNVSWELFFIMFYGLSIPSSDLDVSNVMNLEGISSNLVQMFTWTQFGGQGHCDLMAPSRIKPLCSYCSCCANISTSCNTNTYATTTKICMWFKDSQTRKLFVWNLIIVLSELSVIQSDRIRMEAFCFNAI